MHGEKGCRGQVIETTVSRRSSTCVCSLMFFLYLGDYQKPTEMFWGQKKVFLNIFNLLTVFCQCYRWWRSVTREKINNHNVNFQKIARCLERYVTLLSMNLRWLDTVFQGQYLPSLSINYVAINKVLEKLSLQLYYIKMKICYDQSCNDIGVVIETKWREICKSVIEILLKIRKNKRKYWKNIMK